MGQPKRDEMLVSAWGCGLLLYCFPVALCPTPSLTEPDRTLCHSLGQVHTQDHTVPKAPGPYRMGLGCAVQLYHVALQVLLLHELL